MADQYAIIDQNRKPAGLVHSGTSNDAETIRQTGQTSGAADVHVTGGTVETDAVEVTGYNGGTVSVGTAAVELTFTGQTQGVMVLADHDNTAEIYVGPSNVDTDGANAVARLAAGQALTIDLNDDSAALYAIGGTTGQKAYKMAVT